MKKHKYKKHPRYTRLEVEQTLSGIKGPGRARDWYTTTGPPSGVFSVSSVLLRHISVAWTEEGKPHSSGSRQFDRPAAPALLPAGLVDVVGAQQAASCYESTEHLQSEHTCGSGAGAHRGAVTACLEERRSHARSWRKPSIQVSIPPVASIPQPSEHICCENSAVRRSLDTGSSTPHAEGRGRQESVGTASRVGSA